MGMGMAMSGTGRASPTMLMALDSNIKRASAPAQAWPLAPRPCNSLAHKLCCAWSPRGKARPAPCAAARVHATHFVRLPLGFRGRRTGHVGAGVCEPKRPHPPPVRQGANARPLRRARARWDGRRDGSVATHAHAHARVCVRPWLWGGAGGGGSGAAWCSAAPAAGCAAFCYDYCAPLGLDTMSISPPRLEGLPNTPPHPTAPTHQGSTPPHPTAPTHQGSTSSAIVAYNPGIAAGAAAGAGAAHIQTHGHSLQGSPTLQGGMPGVGP